MDHERLGGAVAAASVATSMDSSAQARKFLAELEHGSSDGGSGSVGLEGFVVAVARNNAEQLVAVAAWTWKRLAQTAQSTFARTAAPTPSSTPSSSRTSSAISFSLSFSFPGSSSSSSSGSSGSAGSEAGVGMSSEESLQMYRNVIFVVTFIPYCAIFLHGIGPSDKVDPKPINAFQFSEYIAYFACFVHMAFQHRLVRSTARWGLITYGVMFILLVGMSTITSFSLGHDREIFYWGYFFQAPFFAMIIWLLVEVVLCWRSGYYHRSQDQTLHEDFKPVISFLCLMTVFLLSVVPIEQLVLPMNVMLEDIIIRGVCVVILYTAPVSINLAGWGRVTSVLRQLLPAAEEIHKVAVSGA